VRNAGIVAQTREVHELADAPGAQSHEATEALQVMYSGQLAQVTLHVGREVVAERLRGVEVSVMNARIEAREQRLRQRRQRMQPSNFGERERQQAQHCSAPGK
jgi:hypothetical protein